LTTLPNSIDKLVNLNYLYLENNKLISLPESIGRLVNLNILNLYENQLTTLPESIGDLVKLRYLSLANNRIISLPESIGRLINLETLFLDNNQLTVLPKSITNIKKSVRVYVNSYEINNLSVDTEFLIFWQLNKELTNLPIGLKEIWIHEEEKNLNHKLPFGCVIKHF
jgi:Leucine-rich repeat (LRR) protein